MKNEVVIEINKALQEAKDNAAAEQAVHDHFIEEYMKGITGSPEASVQTHARSLSLYDFTIVGLRRKRQFEKKAELFEKILLLLQDLP